MNARKPFATRIKGHGKFQRLLERGAQSTNLKSGSVTLAPGKSVGSHVTEGKEELLIILKGQAEVTVEGYRTIRARRFSAIYIPDEVRHDVRNSGTAVLHYVYVVTPVRR